MAWYSPTSPRPKESSLQESKVRTLWSPSLTTKASSIRNFFLQVKPLTTHFTRQFWTECYSVSGVFGQSFTGLENRCCFTIMLRIQCDPCALIPGSEDGSCAWSPSLRPWSSSCWLLPVSPLESGNQKCTFCGRECHQRSCDSRSAIDSTGGLCWLFPEAVLTLLNVCCSGWRLFWRAIMKICLYLLFCLLSDRIHRTL